MLEAVPVFLYPFFDETEVFTVKRMFAVLFISVLLLAGEALAEGQLNVVTTIFPVWDWTRTAVGDVEDVEITMLLDSGVDLHSFQPTARDIMSIANCDVFVYVGGESDEWVEDALKSADNPDMVVVNLMDVLGDGVKPEEALEGMQEEEEGEEEEEEADEHIWLSLRNAEVLTKAIADALSLADPDHADAYAANAEAYGQKLAALDAEYAAMLEGATFDTLLFGDRFPFRYLADDYALNCYAAFSGCSAETEASFETVVFLAGKVDALNLPAVLTLEGSDHRIAETIVQATQSKAAKVLTLDSMQGTTARDVANGASYLGIMAENLEVLKQAVQG